jgi:hypothetical protein
MKTFGEYLTEATKKESKTKKDPSSSRVKCIQDMVAHLKSVFSDYDTSTRKFVWQKLNTAKGKDLIDQLLKNPKNNGATSYSVGSTVEEIQTEIMTNGPVEVAFSQVSKDLR